MKTREQGMLAESIALEYLQENGLTVITQNYHSKGGEIDLIMRDGNDLVFVEVRYRKNNAFGSPIETVTRQKQQRIIHTAQYYLQHHPHINLCCRFDIVGISENMPLTWLKNAFQLN
jgi:putative endonuclease